LPAARGHQTQGNSQTGKRCPLMGNWTHNNQGYYCCKTAGIWNEKKQIGKWLHSDSQGISRKTRDPQGRPSRTIKTETTEMPERRVGSCWTGTWSGRSEKQNPIRRKKTPGSKTACEKTRGRHNEVEQSTKATHYPTPPEKKKNREAISGGRALLHKEK